MTARVLEGEVIIGNPASARNDAEAIQTWLRRDTGRTAQSAGGVVTMTLATAEAGLARKFNQFSDQGFEVPEHSCTQNCVRKHYGGPLSCNDGWPCGDPHWEDRGARCINWTDRGDAPA